MGIVIELDLDTLEYAVEDGTMKVPTPGGEQLEVRVKVAIFADARSGVRVRVPLPFDLPPDTSGLPPGFKPPAVTVGEALLDNKPRIETARSIPNVPPPGTGRR